MAYKVIVNRDLDEFYSEVTLSLYHTSIFGGTLLYSKIFEDNKALSQSYSEETFYKKDKALEVYSTYNKLLTNN